MYFPAAIVYERTDVQRAFNGYKSGVEMNTFYDNDLMLAFAERSLYLVESNMAQNVAPQIVKKLSEIKPVLYKSIKSRDEQRNHMYSFLARVYELEYLYNKNADSLIKMEEVLNEAILFNPTVTDFYRLLGELKILQGKYSEGEEYIKKSCDSLFCNKAESYQRTGVAYFKKGEYELAMKNFQKVLDIDFDLRKQKSESAINFVNPGQFIDNVAIMYYSLLNDIENCRKVYENGMMAYPEYLNVFRQRLESITADYNSKK